MTKMKNKSGFSLVEIMVAVLLLAVLALGGAAVMYQTGGSIQRQQSKREAIVAANHVIESFWNTTFADLGTLAGSSNSVNVTVNGQTQVSTISISAMTNDGNGGNYYEIHVVVPWIAGETVDVVSRRYEKGLSKARVN